ncbi:MAG: hypothetical protein JW880_07580 [Candidatus Thermoplasmatota archaeon]|nr:hypothetical protein [Candidatus Thermoplasmatota archaeon]
MELGVLLLKLIFYYNVDEHVHYLPQLLEVLPETCDFSEEFLVIDRP